MYYLNNNNPARLGHPVHSHELCPACQCLCKVKLWFIAAAPEAEFLCDGNMKNNHHLPTQSLIWKLILHCTHGIGDKCQTKPTKYNQQNIETTNNFRCPYNFKELHYWWNGGLDNIVFSSFKWLFHFFHVRFDIWFLTFISSFDWKSLLIKINWNAVWMISLSLRQRWFHCWSIKTASRIFLEYCKLGWWLWSINNVLELQSGPNLYHHLVK